jgi:hypothetical protein
LLFVEGVVIVSFDFLFWRMNVPDFQVDAFQIRQ